MRWVHPRESTSVAASGTSWPDVIRRHGTLRGRVSLLALGLIAGWLVVLVTGLNLFVRARLDRELNDALQVRAQAVAATVVISDGRIAKVRESPNDQSLDSGVWVFSAGRAVARPAEPVSLQRAAERLAQAAAGFAEDSADNARLYARPVRRLPPDDGRHGCHGSKHSRARSGRAESSSAVRYSCRLLLLLVTYPVFRTAAGRALRPVDRMTNQAAQWSVLEPERRSAKASDFESSSRWRTRWTRCWRECPECCGTNGQFPQSSPTNCVLRCRGYSPKPSCCCGAILVTRTGPRWRTSAAVALSIDKIITTLLVTARADNGPIEGRCEIAAVVRDVLAAVAHEATSELAVDIRPEDLHAGVDGSGG